MRSGAVRRSWGYAAIGGALALLILIGAACCLDHESRDPGDIDHHVMSMGLCSVIVISLPGLGLGALLLVGLIPTLRRETLLAVPLTVPKPPPRLVRSS